MKKLVALVFILFASLFCTACINNLAVQELNQMGKEYLDKGDYDNAIGRFQSSVDLDENIFESRYNLAVAYIAKEDYKNAIDHLKKAIELKPDFADSYYSLGVALESVGFSIEKINEPKEDLSGAIVVEEEITPDMAKEYIVMLNQAILNYEKYLELSPEAKDVQTVKAHIKDIQERITEIKKEYKVQDDIIDEAEIKE